MTGEARQYFRGAPDELLVRPLEGLTLIYHRPSGVTHIVDSPVPEILSQLDAEPRPASMLLARLARQYELEDGEGALDPLVAHLETLCEVGLARAVEPEAKG